MLQETKAPTLTTYPKGKNEFMTFDGSRKIEGKRYFTVKFPGKGDVDVSSVFFTDDSDPPHINMIYMTSQSPKVLWASAIEKAYAAILGGYDQFSDDPTVVWKHVMGRAPKFLSMQSGTQNFASDRDIIRQARKAGTQPMIAAIPAKYHGETVKAVKGNQLVLYDPFGPGDETLSMRELREYQTVFYYDDR